VHLIPCAYLVGRHEPRFRRNRVRADAQGLDGNQRRQRTAADSDRLARAGVRRIGGAGDGSKCPQDREQGASSRRSVAEWQLPHRGELCVNPHTGARRLSDALIRVLI
jgi:hypothetical protein